MPRLERERRTYHRHTQLCQPQLRSGLPRYADNLHADHQLGGPHWTSDVDREEELAIACRAYAKQILLGRVQ
jgi:hypothetical protein